MRAISNFDSMILRRVCDDISPWIRQNLIVFILIKCRYNPCSINNRSNQFKITGTFCNNSFLSKERIYRFEASNKRTAAA